MAANWKTLKTQTLDDGATVEMRYAEFGKGRAKVRSWKFFRDGQDVGYAVNAADAEENWQRVCAGLVRNPETGRYEPRAA